MITEKMYRYVGRNGLITSRVFIENASPIPMLRLQALQGKILTNGTKFSYDIIVFKDEVDEWQEIDDEGQI